MRRLRGACTPGTWEAKIAGAVEASGFDLAGFFSKALLAGAGIWRAVDLAGGYPCDNLPGF